MGTKEMSSGLKGEGNEGEGLRVMGEGDSALTHGALNKDGSAEAFGATTRDCWARDCWAAACWAADLRSR